MQTTSRKQARFYLCSNCSFHTKDSKAKFCEICGAKLITSCPGCRYAIKSIDARFCYNCGKEIRGPKV